jgi:hypothetical protein
MCKLSENFHFNGKDNQYKTYQILSKGRCQFCTYSYLKQIIILSFNHKTYTTN